MASSADFYTMTPGSAVADTLQDILTRRKGEHRQALLDKAAAEEQASVIAARNESQRVERERLELARHEEARQKALAEAQMAESHENIVKGRQQEVGAGTNEEDITDEEVRKRIASQGGFRMAPVSPENPTIEGDTVEGATMHQQYKGSAKEQAESAARDRIAQISERFQSTQDPAERQQLELALVQEGVDPRQIVRRQAYRALDPDTMKMTTYNDIQVPEGQAPDVLPRHPVLSGGRDPNATQNYQITTKDGRTYNASLTPAQLKSAMANPEIADLPTGKAIVEVGQVPGATAMPAPSETMNLYKAKAAWSALHQIDAGQSDLRRSWFPKVSADTLKITDDNYKSALGIVFARLGAQGRVVNAAADIASDPDLAGLDAASAIREGEFKFPGGPLTQQELDMMDKLLNYARGASATPTFPAVGQ